MSGPDAPALSTREIVDTLAEHEVVYIVIGGIAAAAHGSHLVTRDFDITRNGRPATSTAWQTLSSRWAPGCV